MDDVTDVYHEEGAGAVRQTPEEGALQHPGPHTNQIPENTFVAKNQHVAALIRLEKKQV
jgi:hypothetical protein